MERLQLSFVDAQKSLKTLQEIFLEPYSTIVRDATIQRFEYTFETLWKFVKIFLKEKHGVVANSPKSGFRELFTLGYLDESDTEKCLKMTDRRNDTVHTYQENLAEIIFKETRDYANLAQNILKKLTC